MPAQLPPRVCRARMVHVEALDYVELDIDLGFGVTIRRPTRIEGASPDLIASPLRPAAIRALIVLLSGKRLVVHVHDSKDQSPTIGRIYIDERIHGRPVGLEAPPGMTTELLDVSAFFADLKRKNYDIGVVKAALNGGNGGQ